MRHDHYVRSRTSFSKRNRSHQRLFDSGLEIAIMFSVRRSGRKRRVEPLAVLFYFFQQERRLQPIQWVTWEQPRNVHELTGQFRSEDVILLDCLTNWLANELFHEQGWENETYCRQKAEQMLTTITQLATVTKAVVIVSNEVFFGGVPQDIGTYHFMKMLGWLHQRIVQLASCAIVVQHGIPIVKKGDNCL